MSICFTFIKRIILYELFLPSHASIISFFCNETILNPYIDNVNFSEHLYLHILILEGLHNEASVAKPHYRGYQR